MSDTTGLGWSIRREYTCNKGEPALDGWNIFVRCCPEGLSFGMDKGDENAYCEDKRSSSDKIPDSVCADGTWNLWYADAYFCCEPGLTGFISRSADNVVSSSAFGCSNKTYIHDSGLDGKIEEATLTKPEYTYPTSSSKSGPNKGAIAGGVVGGVCGALIIAALIWFLLRRRRRSKISENHESLEDSTGARKDHIPVPTAPPSEIEGDTKQVNELYDYSPARTELEADKQAPQELTGDEIRTTKQDRPYELP